MSWLSIVLKETNENIMIDSNIKHLRRPRWSNNKFFSKRLPCSMCSLTDTHLDYIRQFKIYCSNCNIYWMLWTDRINSLISPNNLTLLASNQNQIPHPKNHWKSPISKAQNINNTINKTILSSSFIVCRLLPCKHQNTILQMHNHYVHVFHIWV